MRYWNSSPPRDAAEAGEWAAYLEDMQRRLGYAQWRVSERAGDRLVGIAGLQPLDGGPEVELTYALEPSSGAEGTRPRPARRRWPTASRRPGSSASSASPGRRTGRPPPSCASSGCGRSGARSTGARRGRSTRWPPPAGARSRRRPGRRCSPSGSSCGGSPPPTSSRCSPCSATPRSCATSAPSGGRSTADEVRGLLTSAEAHWARHGFGPLAVVERASGRVLGEAGLAAPGGRPGRRAHRHTLARAAWGRGYATEAARAVLRWAFAGLRLPRVVAVADPANTRLAARPREARACGGTDGVRATAPRTWRSSA